MDEINFTRRNMRYLGQIESIKYNNFFSEIDATYLKLIKYYNDNIRKLKESLSEENKKKQELKREVFFLNNKKSMLEEHQGGVILQ